MKHILKLVWDPILKLIKMILAIVLSAWLALEKRFPVLVRLREHPRVVAFQELIQGLMQPTPEKILQSLDLNPDDMDLENIAEPRRSNQIFMFIGSFFLIFVLWAFFAELDEVVRAEGVVIPASDVQVVQNRMPGSVRAIAVSLGDRVEKGQVLFSLEDEDALANFDDNEITRLGAIATQARLEAEIAMADKPVFPEFLIEVAPNLVAGEEALFVSRRSALDKKLTVANRSIKEYEAEGKMASAQERNLREEVEILTPMVNEGLEPRLKLLDVQNKLAQAAGAAELAGLAADRMREEYASMIAEFKSSVSSELTEVKKVANQAGAREEAFKAKVEYADVRAPANGIVSAVYVTTIGAVVQGGTTLVEIVSDEQFVLVRAKLLAEDVSNVVVNQEANVSLSAYDVARFGSMKGRIQRIAQNTTIEENRPPFYETIIEIPDPKFSKSTEPVNMIPGMTVVVDIIGKKRSILNYILTPLERASGVVFREK